MRGRALSITAAISLLICLTTAVMWQRSYRRCDVLIGPEGPADRVTFTSEFGVVVFEVESRQQGTALPGWSYYVPPLPRRFKQPNQLLGFAAYRGMARHYQLLPASRLWGVSVPHWFVFTLFAGLPALWLVYRYREMRARDRLKHGLCPRCGYDTRASPTCCSECGMKVLPITAMLST